MVRVIKGLVKLHEGNFVQLPKVWIKMNVKLIWNILYSLVVLALVIVAGAMAISAMNTPNGIKILNVQSGSMEPTISTGSLVLVKPVSNYQKGDIITFKAEKDKNVTNTQYTTTHRIYEIKTVNGNPEYVTKGDANKTPDFITTKTDLIVGKVQLHVPFVGYVISFAKTQNGFILLIVVPATLIIFSEILNIKNEANRLIAERRKKKLNLEESIEEKIGEKIVAIEKKLKND